MANLRVEFEVSEPNETKPVGSRKYH